MAQTRGNVRAQMSVLLLVSDEGANEGKGGAPVMASMLFLAFTYTQVLATRPSPRPHGPLPGALLSATFSSTGSSSP